MGYRVEEVLSLFVDESSIIFTLAIFLGQIFQSWIPNRNAAGMSTHSMLGLVIKKPSVYLPLSASSHFFLALVHSVEKRALELAKKGKDT